MKVEVYEPIRVEKEYNMESEPGESEYDMVVYMGNVEVHRRPAGYFPMSYEYDYADRVADAKDEAVGEFAKRLLKVLGE
jgi:hypothetical protein